MFLESSDDEEDTGLKGSAATVAGVRVAENLAKARDITILVSSGRVFELLNQARSLQTDVDSWATIQIVFYAPPEVSASEAFSHLGDADAADRRGVATSLTREAGGAYSHIFYSSVALPVSGILLSSVGRPDRAYLPTNHAAHLEWLDVAFIEVPPIMIDSIRDSFYLTLAESENWFEKVVVGRPAPNKFYASESIPRTELLRDESDKHHWIGAVVILCTQEDEEGVWPLLQVNTPKTSTRELCKISHISGYLNEIDLVEGGDGYGHVTDRSWLAAASREWRAVGLPPQTAQRLKQLETVRFLYPTRDDLVMTVFSGQIDSNHLLPMRAQFNTWSPERLLDVRYRQLLEQVATVMRDAPPGSWDRDFLAEVLLVNLRLHGQEGADWPIREGLTGDRLARHSVVARSAQLLTLLRKEQRTYNVDGTEVDGIAGMQFREFFRLLLPLYLDSGVSGTGLILDNVNNRLVENLHVLYSDAARMKALPFDI